MAYYLRKSSRSRGIYLQIYNSFFDPVKKSPRSSHVETLGYVCDLVDKGIDDPVSFYARKVADMNADNRKTEEKQISDISALLYLGWFPCDSILRRIDIQKDIDLLASRRRFDYSVYGCLRALLMARLVEPVSKKKTAERVVPRLFGFQPFSYHQILSCIEFLGHEYEKVVEIATRQSNETYILDTEKMYFDCTNYYFEIDREDDWRRKGPSKENRKDPIIGMGLLLDSNCIPIGMRLYPGNQSEKPVLREIVRALKEQDNITGRTVRVADKGLNCAANIHDVLSSGDGYLFSKSVKMLSGKEKTWALLDQGWTEVRDEKGKLVYRCKSAVDTFVYSYFENTDEETRKKVTFAAKEKRIVTYNPKLAKKQLAEIEKMASKAAMCCLSKAKKDEYGESAKYVDFVSIGKDGKETGENVKAELNREKIESDKRCAGYNMLVTSELEMEPSEIYKTYHNLWRIEETFRTMKSQLNARPVFLKSEDCIKGHLLVCYLSVLLERLVQFKVLDNQFGSEEVYDFIHNYQIIQRDEISYTNCSAKNKVGDYIAAKYMLPINNFVLKKKQIKTILEKNL